MSAGWLPPGVTDRDIDEAAPRCSNCEKLQEWHEAAEQECADLTEKVAALQAKLDCTERQRDEWRARYNKQNSDVITLVERCDRAEAALDEAVRERKADKRGFERDLKAMTQLRDLALEMLAEASQRASAAESRLRAYESGDAGELVERLESMAEITWPESSAYKWGERSRAMEDAALAIRAHEVREQKAVEAEREACAAQAEVTASTYGAGLAGDLWIGQKIATAIRARTATGGEG